MRAVTSSGVRARAVCGSLALIAALTLLGTTIPAAADPAPPPETTPPAPAAVAGSVPPSTAPPFVLDAQTDQLTERIGTAERDRIELTARDGQLRTERATRATDLLLAVAQVDRITADLQQAVTELAAAEDHVRRLAVATYKHHGASKLVELMLSAPNVRSFGFGAEMLQRADDAQQRTAAEARTRRDALDLLLRDATARRATAESAIAETDGQIAETTAGLERAAGTIRSASAALEQHLPGVSLPGTAILGDQQLTAAQILAWYRSTGAVANVGVGIDELIDDYLTEGAAEHVRGDIAFLQSIVETGYFSFPGAGQVGTGDHNFAGIGACDSCAHGDHFASALEGIRAQVQLLRFYADPTMTERQLTNPAVRDLDRLGVKGCCPTWYSLTGTWATAPTYGPVILDLYQQVLDHAAANPASAAS
jgi:hypothetical protein